VQRSNLAKKPFTNNSAEKERFEHDGANSMIVRRAFQSLLLIALAFTGSAQTRQRDISDPPAKQYFTDVVLINQDGQRLRLYSDLLRGKTVIFDTFFASCKNSCPRMSAVFSDLQERLGKRLGNGVLLLSLTVDPQTDTPEKLKAYADHFHAKPGWMFLTGNPEDVQFALNKFGQRVEQRENHFNLYIVGNEATGLWKKVLPMHQSGEMRTADELMEVVDSVTHDRQ
jgi:protein SCO1/2